MVEGAGEHAQQLLLSFQLLADVEVLGRRGGLAAFFLLSGDCPGRFLAGDRKIRCVQLEPVRLMAISD